MASMGQPSGPPPQTVDYKGILHAEIINYFNKEGQTEIVKAIKQSSLKVGTTAMKILSSRRDLNGADDPMDADVKDDVTADGASNGKPGDAFLLDWWSSFFDIWTSRSGGEPPNGIQSQFLHSRMRQQQNQNMMNPAMMQGNMGPYRAMMPTQLDLQRKAIVNNRNLNPQFQQRGMQQPQMGQTQMQREGSDTDMNGQPRAQSPMSAENAPSPKRQRVDGGGLNGAMGGRTPSMGMQMPNGSAPGNQMLMQSGLDPNNLTQGQLAFGQPGSAQQKYAQGIVNSQRSQMEGVKNGGPPNMAQGSPMMSGPDGQIMANDFLTPNQMNRNMPGAGMNTNGGALADYQMQLMLLEQQNKKRLMMARQEHDQHQRGDGTGYGANPQGGMPGQAGFAAPGMSPRNSRTGQSPNPTEQMKRQTPKMGPNSPLPDGSMPVTRGSPGPGFEGMPPNAPFYPMSKAGEAMMGPQNGMVRPPPSSHPGFTPPNGQMTPQQLEMIRQQNGGRMPNWPPGQQMMPQQAMQQAQAQQQQQQQNDNAQQRNNMPPPQAPPAGGNNARQNPSSPSQSGAAPPTPQTTNKANPKGKKDGKDSKKKTAKKNQSTTGATPSSEAENPQTPPPPTPITPQNPQSFSIGAKGPQNQNQAQNQNQGQNPGQNQQQGSQSQPAQANMPQATAGVAPPTDGNTTNGVQDMQLNIGDFAFTDTFDNTDVLEAFDFDSFLQMDNDTAPWDLESSQFPIGGDGVETGAGEA